MAREDSLSETELSKTYNVSRKTIYNIVNRLTWNKVPVPLNVSGFGGSYVIYPDGRVRHADRAKFMTQSPRKSGPVVKLTTKAGVRKTVSVNSLLKSQFGIEV